MKKRRLQLLGATAALTCLLAAGLWLTSLGQDGVEPLATLGVRGWPQNLEFSPDGSCLAVACMSGAVQCYSTETWDLLWDVSMGASVTGLGFSPDGSALAISQSESLEVTFLDPLDGTELRIITLTDVIHGHPDSRFYGVFDVDFSPNGQLLACTERVCSSLKLVDVETGEELGTPIKHDAGDGYVLAEFNPAGTYLASSTEEGDLVILTVSSRRISKSFQEVGVCDIAFAPDGTLFTASLTDSGDRIQKWHKSQWTASDFGPPDEEARYGVVVAVSPDGSLVASGFANLRLLDADTEEVLWTHVLPRNGALWMRFSQDGSLLAVGLAKKATVEIWQVSDILGE